MEDARRGTGQARGRRRNDDHILLLLLLLLVVTSSTGAGEQPRLEVGGGGHDRGGTRRRLLGLGLSRGAPAEEPRLQVRRAHHPPTPTASIRVVTPCNLPLLLLHLHLLQLLL